MKKFKTKISNNKGITLITLVVTIIVLIILAGVSLHILLKDNGVIDKAKESQEIQDIARIQESLELLKGPILIDEYEVNLDNYLKTLDTEKMREKYKVTQIERVDGANYAYVVLENKYRYKIENDPSNEDNVIITYNGPEADLLLSEYTGNFIYPETKTITVTKNASNGTLSVTSSNEDIAKATIEGNTITIISGQTTGTATITVKSTKDGNEDVAVYKAIVSQKQIKLEVEVYEGIYDGQPHNAVKITTLEPEDATVKYYLDGVDYGTTIPQITGAKTYSISIEASKAGYTPITITETVIIGKAEVGEGNLSLSETSGTITYPEEKTFTIDTNASGGKITVTSSNDAVAEATLGEDKKTVTITPQILTADNQKVTITVTSAATDNYEEQTATYEATVDRGEIKIEATPYTGAYDGQEHDALTYVKVTPEDATVTYYLNGENKGSTIPKVTSAGQYSISIEASKAGYRTSTKTDTVAEIGQQGNTEGNLVLSEASGTVTYPTPKTFTVKTNVSDGELSVSSSNNAIAKASISGTTVTITPQILTADNQKVTITVTSAAKGTYGEQTATYEATVNRGQITLEATAYTGGYDGQAHDAITITKLEPEDVTVKYYLNETDYGTTIPQVSEIGTYIVAIEASKAGYITKPLTKTIIMNTTASEILKVGNFVRYTPTEQSFTMKATDTGYSSDQEFSTGDYTGLWKVLYNDSDHGLQLISADSVGYLYLSGSTGYNKVVSTLNTFSSKYLNTYASSGRSVGTDPKTPSTDTSENVQLVFNSDTGLLKADTRYTKDVEAMQAADTLDINGYYWVPSRYTFSTSEVGYFGIYTISADGTAEYRRMKDMYVNGSNYEYAYAYGVRPVVTIKTGINAISGTGSEKNPFELGN